MARGNATLTIIPAALQETLRVSLALNPQSVLHQLGQMGGPFRTGLPDARDYRHGS